MPGGKPPKTRAICSRARRKSSEGQAIVAWAMEFLRSDSSLTFPSRRAHRDPHGHATGLRQLERKGVSEGNSGRAASREKRQTESRAKKNQRAGLGKGRGTTPNRNVRNGALLGNGPEIGKLDGVCTVP